MLAVLFELVRAIFEGERNTQIDFPIGAGASALGGLEQSHVVVGLPSPFGYALGLFHVEYA